jgi:hypothetical protein
MQICDEGYLNKYFAFSKEVSISSKLKPTHSFPVRIVSWPD